jgi:N-acetylglutamate synthase-like GNAT family acetyltransferase
MEPQIESLADHLDAIPMLARLHHAEWHLVTPHLRVDDRIARFQARTCRGEVPTSFVAVMDRRVVGVACLVEYDVESRKDLTPWLASVLVVPEYRRRGIGSRLSERVAKEANRLGFAALYLITTDKADFYARLGWFALAATEHFGRRATIMVRTLSAGTDLVSKPSV